MSFDLARAMPFVPGTLYARLRDGAAEAWQAYVDHRFVRALGDGTLDRGEFLAWMVQDYLYLIHYARAYALLVYKSDTVARMRAAAATLDGLLGGEMTLHRRFLNAAGVDDGRIEHAAEALETIAYGRYILDRAQAGDALDLLVTLSACLVGYGEIGLRLRADPRTRLDANPYRDWIETYAGEEYLGLARVGVAQMEELARDLGGEARTPHLQRQFTAAVRLEAAFWDAGRGGLGVLPVTP